MKRESSVLFAKIADCVEILRDIMPFCHYCILSVNLKRSHFR
jgi:hypothetical protein